MGLLLDGQGASFEGVIQQECFLLLECSKQVYMTYIQRSQSQELQFQSQKAAAQVKILQDPLAGGEKLFSAKLTQILQGISLRKSFALASKLRQRQPLIEIKMPYVVVLLSDYSMGLRSIFSIRTCPYFWCFRHLMGGASNPAYRVFNRKISTSPSTYVSLEISNGRQTTLPIN